VQRHVDPDVQLAPNPDRRRSHVLPDDVVPYVEVAPNTASKQAGPAGRRDGIGLILRNQVKDRSEERARARLAGSSGRLCRLAKLLRRRTEWVLTQAANSTDWVASLALIIPGGVSCCEEIVRLSGGWLCTCKWSFREQAGSVKAARTLLEERWGLVCAAVESDRRLVEPRRGRVRVGGPDHAPIWAVELELAVLGRDRTEQAAWVGCRLAARAFWAAVLNGSPNRARRRI
jgi:hypothetical protein